MSEPVQFPSKPARSVYLYSPSNTTAWLGALCAAAFSGGLYSLHTAKGTDYEYFLGFVVLVSFLIGVPLLASTRSRLQRSRRETQDDRDRFARALLLHFAEPHAPPLPFALYLRPFFTDHNFPSTYRLEEPSSWRHGTQIHFEQILADGLDRWIALVALGGRRQSGTGCIEVNDERWQETFLLMARKVSFIVAVPFAQRATDWEIMQLRKWNLLEKTIFVVPPPRKIKQTDFTLDRTTRRSADIFDLSAEHFAKAGLQLPPQCKDGGFFMLRNDGSASMVRWLKKRTTLDPALVDRALRMLVEKIPTRLSG